MIIRQCTQQAYYCCTVSFAIAGVRLELQQQCNISCNHSSIIHARRSVRKLLIGNTPAGSDLSRSMKTVYAIHKLEYSTW